MNRSLCFLAFLLIITSTYSQWFDKESMSATVLIEREIDSIRTRPYGTGILFYNYKNSVNPIVVTCAHLINPPKLIISTSTDSIFYSYYVKNKVDITKHTKYKWKINEIKTSCHYTLDTIELNYVKHDKLDIAAFPLPSHLIDIDIENYINKSKCIPHSVIRRRDDVELGDEVYFIGFPLGIGAQNNIEPLLRSGSIAWAPKNEGEFLLDAFSFGGNSGSPIFMKNILRKPGTLEWDGTFLIGIIFGHYSENREGILVQPDPRINIIQRQDFETNSGLARCHWIDDILPIVEKASKLVL